MTRMMWITSCAALALTAPAAAKDRDKDRQVSAEQRSEARQAPRGQRSEQGARAQQDRQPRREMRVERPQRAEQRVQRETRIARPQRVERQAQRELRVERPQRVERRAQRELRVERPRRVERRVQREMRLERPQRAERQVQARHERQARRVERVRTAPIAIERRNRRIAEPRIEQRADREERRLDRRIDRVERREARTDRQAAGRAFAPVRSWQEIAERRALQSAKVRIESDRSPSFTQALLIGQQVDRDWDDWDDRYVPLTYRTRYVDTRDYYYRFDDDAGYLYRIDRDDDIVSALFPLLGGNYYGGYYGIGQPMPYAYRSSWVPYGYQSLYYDTPDSYYRYAGGSIYQVDPTSQLIMGLVALLSGQNFGIGQMLPASYNAYNVPFGFRDQYYDTQDDWYRYDDGYIYQVDPYSRLIEASYPVYGDGYYVGSEWPVAYPDYNVPYGYRDLYADSGDWQYRYANGAIYQVDPQSHLIQALVALVTGNQFAVGQPMPLGYDVYNVPTDYRDRYYDTASSWYRYDDGFIYEVDPRSGQIEEAIPVYA